MPNQPTGKKKFLANVWPWLAVLFVLLFVGFIRFRLLDMPLERDEGEYAYAGQLILQGVPPYELAYNMKLPGTYYAYALGMAIFGQTIQGIHLTLLSINAATIVFVFLLGRKIFGTVTGLFACASYGLMSVSTSVFGTAAHATQFAVLFAVPGTLQLWNALHSGGRRAIFYSGLLYGISFVVIQQAITFGLFGFLALLWHERRKNSDGWNLGKNVLLFVLGAVLPFAIVCIYLFGIGVFPGFWLWTFSYAKTYAGQVSLSEGLTYFSDYLRDQWTFFIGFWILSVVGLLAGFWKPEWRKRSMFAVIFFLFSFLGTVPGFYFRPHYFVLTLPALAILFGMAVEVLQPVLRTKFLPVVLAIVVFIWGFWIQRWAFFQLPPAMLAQVIYRSNPVVESISAARYIREHSDKDARIAVVGSEPQIYFYAHRRAATGYLYVYPLMEDQPYALAMQHQMINEIESAKPQFIVLVVNQFSWLINDYSKEEILTWVQQYIPNHYDSVGILSTSSDPLRVSDTEIWGNDAKKNLESATQSLIIYQRKSN